MICKNCGTENTDARFCKECGTPLLFICANCGAGNLEGKFCKECGAKLLSEIDDINTQSFESISQKTLPNVVKGNNNENNISEASKSLATLKFRLFEKNLEYPESAMMFGDFMRTSIGFKVFINARHNKFIEDERKLDSYLHNLPAFLNTVVTTALTTVEEMVSKYYDFSELSIPQILSCYQEYFDYTTYIAPFLSEYQRICGCEINIDNYYSNIPSSGGRWVGGGFGFGGALKGALTAGMLNVGSSLINGVGNYIAKGVELSRLDSEKEKLHSICKSYVSDYLKELSSNCLFVAEEILANYTNYEKFSYNYDEADDIFNSIDASSIDDAKEKITKCLVLYPFRSDFYEFIVDHYENAGDDLEKLAETFLGDSTIQEYKLDIEKSVYNLIKEEGLDKCKAEWGKNVYANSILNKIENEAKNNISKAKVVFQNALNGGDVSEVKNMLSYIDITKEYLTDTELLCMAGEIYEDNCYGVNADTGKSILYYEFAAKLEDVTAMERLSLLYHLSENEVKAESWARKALSFNADSIQAKKILGIILNKKHKSIDECKEAIELYNCLSNKQYSDLGNFYTPAYFCYCAAEVYERNDEDVRNNDKAIGWYIKGAKLALEHPEDSWGESCCVAAISKLRNENRHDEMVAIAFAYKDRCFFADYTLGYAYCRGTSVIKDYNIGAKCFISVINNYDVSEKSKEYQNAYRRIKKDSQEALDKMICKNGIWKKKMFENF